MSTFFDAVRDQMSYFLSLPERTIRSLAAVSSGVTNLLTESVFPEALKGTTMYQLFIGDTQRFVTDVSIQNLTDLLGAMQDASRRGAATIDSPPLTREDLAKLAKEMTDNYGRMFSKTLDLVPRLDRLWERMNAVARSEDISLEK